MVASPARIEKILLSPFRSHASFRADFDERPIGLVGPNGSGKTNILEALSLLSPGRGLRRATYDKMIPLGQDAFTVFAAIDNDGMTHRVGTTVERGTARRVRLDGQDVHADRLLDHLRILWVLPAMDRLFSGPPDDRRRLLDRFVLAADPRHGERVIALDKTIRMRNRLLDDGASRSFIRSVERELALHALAVSMARKACVVTLQGHLDSHDDGFPRPQLEYLDGFADHECDSVDAILDLFERTRSADYAAKRTRHGPHRADLTGVYVDKNTEARNCSTGEQKAMVISLVLAQAAITAQIASPLVLLDEVGAHLDKDRREKLFSVLSDLGCQFVMTGVETASFGAAGRPMNEIALT